MAKKKNSTKLTYFLDHPQIKRHESVGNGNVPGSLADKINFGGKNPKPAASTTSTPKQPSSSSTSSSGGVMSALKGLFKK